MCLSLCKLFFSSRITAPRILKFGTNIRYDFSFSPIKFFVKDFSGTTAPRISKFHINIGYDFLYCVRENQHPRSYHSLYLSFFSFSSRKLFITDFSAPKRARVFKFYIHLKTVEVSCVREKHSAEVSFDFFLLFSFFFPSLTPVYCIGKFVPKISQELLHLGFQNLAQTLGTTTCIM